MIDRFSSEASIVKLGLGCLATFAVCVAGCFPRVPDVTETPPKAAIPSQSSESESKEATQAKEPKENPPVSDAQIEEFFQAAATGDVAQVQRLVSKGVPIDATNADGNTALMLAAFDGHSLVVDYLIKNGAKVDLRNSIKRTALMFAATGTSVDTVELLLKAGAEINAKDGHENWTPLMFAAPEGHLDVIRKLLDNGANIDDVDTDGESASYFAQQQGHPEVVELIDSYRKK